MMPYCGYTIRVSHTKTLQLILHIHCLSDLARIENYWVFGNNNSASVSEIINESAEVKIQGQKGIHVSWANIWLNYTGFIEVVFESLDLLPVMRRSIRSFNISSSRATPRAFELLKIGSFKFPLWAKIAYKCPTKVSDTMVNKSLT